MEDMIYLQKKAIEELIKIAQILLNVHYKKHA